MSEAALFLRKCLDFLTFLFHFMLDPEFRYGKKLRFRFRFDNNAYLERVAGLPPLVLAREVQSQEVARHTGEHHVACHSIHLHTKKLCKQLVNNQCSPARSRKKTLNNRH
jgi:hypothetical protein